MLVRLPGLDSHQAAARQVADQAREVGHQGIRVAIGETGGEDRGNLAERRRLLEQPPERGAGGVEVENHRLLGIGEKRLAAALAGVGAGVAVDHGVTGERPGRRSFPAGIGFGLGLGAELRQRALEGVAQQGGGLLGAIGGVRQKVIAARDAGAGYVLVPTGNLADALDAAGDDIEVVAVDTVDDALGFLAGLPAG